MKKVFLLLMLVSPLLSIAQVDDMYFVPKKEKKVLVVKSAEEIYMEDVDSVELTISHRVFPVSKNFSKQENRKDLQSSQSSVA